MNLELLLSSVDIELTFPIETQIGVGYLQEESQSSSEAAQGKQAQKELDH